MTKINGENVCEWDDLLPLGLKPGDTVYLYTGTRSAENNAEPAKLVRHKQLGQNIAGTIDRWTKSFAQVIKPEYFENGYIILAKPTAPLPNPFRK